MIKISDNTFIISDLHLTHKNIIKYCNRQYDLSPEGVAKMKEDLLSEFDKLPTTCAVWNLGDLFDTKPHSLAEAKEVVKRMKGPKGLRKLYLVLGNHDVCRLSNSRIKFYYEAGFDKVYDSPIIVNEKFILSHEPVYIAPGSNFINIYGHTHDIPIDTGYFTKDFDNWAMIARVCRKDGLPEPKIEDYIKWPEKVVNLNNYFNVCWDYTHKILDFNQVIKTFN